MKFAEKFLKKFKKQNENVDVESFIKDIPEHVLKSIERKAVENYINSDTFNDEVNTIIKSLGDEWYNQYKERNTKETKTNNEYELKETKQMSLDDYNKELENELAKNGFGKEFPKIK